MRKFDELGYLIADSELDPLKDCNPTIEEIRTSLDSYILSSSGWRAVFAISKNEEDRTEEVSSVDRIITATVAKAFIEYLDKPNPIIVLGRDARPTGRVLQDIIARIFISLGAEVHLISISSAPEAMCYLKGKSDAFFYISASHNPVGHNGFKFGSDGGVYNKTIVDKIATSFKTSVLSEEWIESVKALSSSLSTVEYDKVLKAHDKEKKASVANYRKFVLNTAYAKPDFSIPFGIVADSYGSARATSGDMALLSSLGAKVWSVNERAGQIDHKIVPEGENLELCRKTLEKANKLDDDYILGYMPDNDGDRGNFVYIKSGHRAEIVNAQDVFALISAIDMAHQAIRREKAPAVAVNGPTSHRVDEIASKLGVKVFRSDIGENNVVTLADRLRSDGYSVHVCGEGSNGGIITSPARVRDPMNSIMSIAKLYSVEGLYSLLMSKLGGDTNGSVSLRKLIAAIPKYATTPAFSKDAVLRIKCPNFDDLKLEYERLFLSEVSEYMKDGITSYEIRQYEGSDEKIGIGEEFRTLPSQGGYKVILSGDDGFKAALWFSKSRTEPVMRVMADVKGDNWALHDKLLMWQRSLVERADKAIS